MFWAILDNPYGKLFQTYGLTEIIFACSLAVAQWRIHASLNWEIIGLGKESTPRQYLNHCWIVISEVLWFSTEGNFARDAQHISHRYEIDTLLI